MGTTQSLFSIPKLFLTTEELLAHLEDIVNNYETFGSQITTKPTILQNIQEKIIVSEFKEYYDYLVKTYPTSKSLEALLTRFTKVEHKLVTLRDPNNFNYALTTPLLQDK